MSDLHLVHAFAAPARLVPGQMAVDDKSNVITALPALLEMLSPKGRIVTADAMHAQRATAGAVAAMFEAERRSIHGILKQGAENRNAPDGAANSCPDPSEPPPVPESDGPDRGIRGY